MSASRMNLGAAGEYRWLRAAGIGLLALTLLGTIGCRTPRLAGENFPADRPAYVSAAARTMAAEAANHPASGPPAHRLILIGDSGDPLPDDPTLAALGKVGDQTPEHTTVVFLGDNLYPSGLQDDDRERGEAVLRQQLSATRATKIFVPGNHDWGMTDPTPEAVRNQGEFVASWSESPALQLPKNGCPGPAVHTLLASDGPASPAVQLVLLDTEWWLVPPERRPTCDGIDGEADVVRELEETLAQLGDALVVVASHHPLRTGGPHGGFSRGWLADRVTAIVFALLGTLQDVDEPDYQRLVTSLSGALKSAPPLVYAAGHDHSLQLIEGQELADMLVVSGAGSHNMISTVTPIDGTLFAHAREGFVVLDFHREPGGTVPRIRVVETGVSDPVIEIEMRAH